MKELHVAMRHEYFTIALALELSHRWLLHSEAPF
jgi:hypothetical protein